MLASCDEPRRLISFSLTIVISKSTDGYNIINSMHMSKFFNFDSTFSVSKLRSNIANRNTRSCGINGEMETWAAFRSKDPSRVASMMTIGPL